MAADMEFIPGVTDDPVLQLILSGRAGLADQPNRPQYQVRHDAVLQLHLVQPSLVHRRELPLRLNPVVHNSVNLRQHMQLAACQPARP